MKGTESNFGKRGALGVPVLLIALLLAAALSTGAAADWGDPYPVCECKGGGDTPGPFSDSNRKVELSDGDVYALSGRVIFLSPGSGKRPTPYFEVDLKQHEWLANAKRVLNPYYRLQGPTYLWKEFEYETIRLQARARARSR